MNSKLPKRLLVGAGALLVAHPYVAAADEGAEKRVDKVLDHFIESPTAEAPITDHPVKPGNVFSRRFNITVSGRAYLQLMTDPSKDASSSDMIEKVGQYYLDHPDEIPDPDSTYWAGEYHSAALAKFGINGTVRKGAIDRKAEVKMLEYMVAYLNEWSRLEFYDQSLRHQTYYYWNSENHWWQEIVVSWGYLLALKDDPDFKDTVLDDGRTLDEHYTRTVAYMKEHMRQRVRKGFLVEISSGGYAGRMHNMYFMIYELSTDEDLKALASKTLDLWWAFWAEEQIQGERGGGKVRHRRLRGLLPNSESHMVPVWYYTGLGSRDLGYLKRLKPASTVKPLNYMAVLSDYRPAPFVYEILADRSNAPPFSITQRRVGKSAGQDETAPAEILNPPPDPFGNEGIQKHKFYDFEDSDVLKYSWVSPNFILGTNMRPPLDASNWVAGSAQGWWHGLLLNNPGNNYPERVVPTLIYPRDSMGEQYAVQSRGSMMARKLNDVWRGNSDNRKYPMGIFISSGLEEHTTLEGEFIFVEGPTAWVAIRAVDTEFVWANRKLERRHQRAGNFYELMRGSMPVIIEAAEHDEYESFEAFKRQAKLANLSHIDGAYHYDSLSGDRLTMFDDRSRPMINSKLIDYTPA